MRTALYVHTLLAIFVLGGCSTGEPTASADQSKNSPATPDSVAVADSKQAERSAPAEADKPQASRKFHFFYDVIVDDLKPGAKARIWIPKAQSSHDQTIHSAKLLLPTEAKESTEEKFGNRLMYFEAVADEKGQIPVLVEYVAERKESRINSSERAKGETQKLFLTGSSLVPADGSILKEVFAEKKPSEDNPLALAKTLYHKVDERMTYGKPKDKAWGRGDAFFACREGVGNCTDFHSMFIALARDLDVPAKFEIGFPLPPSAQATKGKIGGYHCWAKFAADGRWIGVDISEADKHPEMKEYYFGNLTPDRITFSTGRDLQLVPKNDTGLVNFLVYPHVEVDGKLHKGLIKQFRFEDIKR